MTTPDLMLLALTFTSFGIGIGLMVANWRPKKKANYRSDSFFPSYAPQHRTASWEGRFWAFWAGVCTFARKS
jgi:hypothetical protein